jgi:hypothetical protein
MISRFVVRFERNAVPMLPFLAVGGGWLLDRVADWLGGLIARRRDGEGQKTIWSNAIAFAGCAVLLALPLTAASSLDLALTQVDQRELAGRWVEENIEPGTKIALEHYSIPFHYARYQVEDVLRVTDHDLAWYLQEGFDILIVSDGVWPILERQPATYRDKVSAYRALTEKCTLLVEFVPRPPSLIVAGYPTVAVYHFAPVRIFRLPEGE